MDSFRFNFSSSKQGKTPVGKQGDDFSGFKFGSSSRSSVIAEEELLKSEFGCSPKQSSGIPIKELLAEEMGREAELKRRTPGVIARLMGLDGLTSPQSSHKQANKSSEKCERTILFEKPRRSGKFDSRSSSKKNSWEQQEFKDVFEVLETSQVQKRSCSPQGITDSRFTEPEMAFIQEKFMDVKRLSTDEKLYNSKEFNDALEVLDSNKDLLLQFLQQPDSLFTKHLNDLQGSLPQTYCDHRAAMNSTDVLKYQNSSQRKRIVERETPYNYHVRPSEQHNKGNASQSYIKHSCQSSRHREHTPPPTRIVVLKPNIVKGQVDLSVNSSPRLSRDYLSDGGSRREISNMKHRRAASLGDKNIADDAGILEKKSRESRELAKVVTRKMRKNFRHNLSSLPSSAAVGYAGDESSSSMSGNESAHELEIMTVTSRDSFHQNHSLSSRRTESSVNREAKKRLSERWEVAHRSRELGAISRGSTLGEMLAISDMDIKPAPIGKKKLSNRSACKNEPVRWDEPLGISSQDGWKDGNISYLPRSRSLPASSYVFHSPKAFISNETPWGNISGMPKEVTRRDRKKAAKGHFDLEESSYYKNPKSSRKKPQTPCCPIQDETSSEIGHILNKVENVGKDTCSISQDANISKASAIDITDNVSNYENSSGVVIENTTSESIRLDSILSDDKLAKCNKSPVGQDISHCQEQSNRQPAEGSVSLHHPVAELGSPRSSKEAEQPSPISILEPPFKDDLSSSSECFESVSADLQGLRMQLQLLKMESETYNEGAMIVSSDDDARQESFGTVEDTEVLKAAKSWESSYIVDIFVDSSFSNADPDTFIASCHSPDCPINPLKFEELEKKYADQTSCPKLDRRLLFDRINLGLVEIYQHCSDPYPWVKRKRAGRKWARDDLINSLIVLLKNKQDKSDDELAKVMACDSQWLDLIDDTDVVGRQIERLIVDDLVAEMVTIYVEIQSPGTRL